MQIAKILWCCVLAVGGLMAAKREEKKIALNSPVNIAKADLTARKLKSAVDDLKVKGAASLDLAKVNEHDRELNQMRKDKLFSPEINDAIKNIGAAVKELNGVAPQGKFEAIQAQQRVDALNAELITLEEEISKVE